MCVHIFTYILLRMQNREFQLDVLRPVFEGSLEALSVPLASFAKHFSLCSIEGPSLFLELPLDRRF